MDDDVIVSFIQSNGRVGVAPYRKYQMNSGESLHSAQIIFRLINVGFHRPSKYIQDKLTHISRLDQTSNEIYAPTIIKLIQDKELGIKGCDVPIDRPLFQPEPSNMTIKGYLPFKTYELVIQFRNLDKVNWDS